VIVVLSTALAGLGVAAARHGHTDLPKAAVGSGLVVSSPDDASDDAPTTAGAALASCALLAVLVALARPSEATWRVHEVPEADSSRPVGTGNELCRAPPAAQVG